MTEANTEEVTHHQQPLESAAIIENEYFKYYLTSLYT